MYEHFDFNWEKATFEWDPEKEKQNFIKHGIKFKTAMKVFQDPSKLIRSGLEHPWEGRYNILGEAGKILFVVCVFRTKNTVRIISARLATISERERYSNGKNETERYIT